MIGFIFGVSWLVSDADVDQLVFKGTEFKLHHLLSNFDISYIDANIFL